MPNLMEELQKVRAFNGHLAYRHEHAGDKEWVYSVGINNTTVDIITGVDHNQWTESEMTEFIDHVRGAAAYHKHVADNYQDHISVEASGDVPSLVKQVDRPVDDEVGEKAVDEGNQATA